MGAAAAALRVAAAPPRGYPLLRSSRLCAVMAGGQQVGVVTSGTLSPSLGVGAALAYVSPEHAHVGAQLSIDVRGKQKAAEVTRLPMVDSSPRKEDHP